MKNKDKVKKVHENKIGKIIYGFLMFMPLMAILTTCLYAIFNKNAKDSYYGETINDKQLIEIEDITTYTGKIVYDTDTLITYTSTNGTNIFNIDNFNAEITNLDNEQVRKIQMYSSVYQSDYNMWLSLRDINNNVLKNINLSQTIIYFTCDIIDYSKTQNNTIIGNFGNYFYKVEYNKYSYVSEAFYYSIEQTENSNLFNWAKDSVIYIGMHDFTTQLNVSNTFMPMLLSYWLIVSIIYFLYDIALIMLNIVHRKIHELQDSL